MTVKELLIKFQEYQLEYEVLNANCFHNAAANLFMKRYGVKNCSIPDVMQQSELLLEFINWKNDKDKNWLKFIDAKEVDDFLKFKQ